MCCPDQPQRPARGVRGEAPRTGPRRRPAAGRRRRRGATTASRSGRNKPCPSPTALPPVPRPLPCLYVRPRRPPSALCPLPSRPFASRSATTPAATPRTPPAELTSRPHRPLNRHSPITTHLIRTSAPPHQPPSLTIAPSCPSPTTPQQRRKRSERRTMGVRPWAAWEGVHRPQEARSQGAITHPSFSSPTQPLVGVRHARRT